MSAYEDVKKGILDFVAPELRTLSARLERFEKMSAERLQRLEEKIDANHREVMNALNMKERS
jgi:hypothetical protein